MNLAEQAYERLCRQLLRLRRRWRINRFLQGFSLAALFFLGSEALFGLTESILWFSPWVRTILASVIAASAAWILLTRGVIPLFRQKELGHFALMVENRFPQFKQRLIGALQLWGKRRENPEGYSPEMIEQTVIQADHLANEIGFHRVIDKRPLLKSVKILTVVGCLWIPLLLFSSSFNRAVKRCLSPSTRFVRPPEVTIQVSPGDTALVKGADLKVKIVLMGKIPSEVRLLSRPLSFGHGQWTETVLRPKKTACDTLSSTFDKLRDSINYYVQAGQVQSPIFRAEVYELPMVKEISLYYRFPAYTHLESRVEDTGDILAVAGTRVLVKILANKPLQKARLVFERRAPKQMEVNDRIAKAEIVIQGEDRYYVELTDLKGRHNLNPIRYHIEAIRDRAPAVRIVQPGRDTELAENMLLPLRIEAVDDFGISRMELRFQQTWGSSPRLRIQRIPLFSAGKMKVNERYIWDLSSLDVLPGDSLSYWIRAYDNNSLTGPQFGESRRFLLYLPTFAEIFRRSEAEQAQQLTSMEEIVQQLQTTRDRLEQFRRKLLRKQPLSWDEKREIQTAIQNQERIATELNTVAGQLDQLTQRLTKRDLVTLDTLKKLQQLKQLVEQTVTPEMKRILQKLREAINKVDPQQLQQALRDFNLSQEELQKRIERTIAILKQLQREERIDALVKQAEKIVKRQKLLKESTRPEADLKRLADQQKDIKEDTERLRQSLEQLKELSAAWQKQIDSQLQLIDRKALMPRMQQAASLLEAGKTAEAKQMEETLLRDLNQLSIGLKSLQQAIMQDYKAEVAGKMRKALHDLLYLSQRQEKAFHQQEKPSLDLWWEEVGETQEELREGASAVADSLDQVAKKTFWVDSDMISSSISAVKMMNKAIAAVENKNLYSLRRHQREALRALNRTAIQLYQALSALSQASSGTGFNQLVQQLEQLTQEQQRLNQATQQFKGRQGLPAQQQSLLAALAAQQRALQREVEMLAQKIGTRRDVLGRIDQLAQEMDKVARDLESRRVTSETVKRQQGILSRLLAAQHSLRKAGLSRKRESEVGQNYTRPGTIALPSDLGEREDLLRYELQKALKQGYPEEYEELLIKYFEAISGKLTGQPR